MGLDKLFSRAPTKIETANDNEAGEENEQVAELHERIDVISNTGERSAQHLREVEVFADRHPEYFEGDETLSSQFWSRVQEKVVGLSSGIDLMQKKAEFAKKWKDVSAIVAVGSVAVTVGAGAWASKYGFDATYMKEFMGTVWNVPMTAALITTCLAGGSAGIANLREMFTKHKAFSLSENFHRYNYDKYGN